MVYEDLFKTYKQPGAAPEEDLAQVEKPAADARALILSLLRLSDPAERQRLLAAGLFHWPTDQTLLLLDEYFRLRYEPIKGKGGKNKIPYADKLLALLVEAMTMTSIGKQEKTLKFITKQLRNSPLILWADGQEKSLQRELLFGEWMNALDYFVDSCRRDSKYASTLMGLVKASQEKTDSKLIHDLSLLKLSLHGIENNPKIKAEWNQAMLLFPQAIDLYLANFPN